MSSFKFQVDASERMFVTIANNEATKNHPGGVTQMCQAIKNWQGCTKAMEI